MIRLKLSRKNLRLCHRACVTAQSFNGSVTYTSKLEKRQFVYVKFNYAIYGSITQTFISNKFVYV
ncbi:hypothetical protein HanXRQr2_Chr10g0433001 [Helianthus annuus]|nr:hypothetical protein HanXRQr2_Chr10g0433001 [Helianthus annuus]